MDYKKFQGKKIEEVARYCKDISSYNNNYYEDDTGNLILARSDDDDYTGYTLVTVEGEVTFAESFCSQDDVIEVFNKFLEEE